MEEDEAKETSFDRIGLLSPQKYQAKPDAA